MSRSNTNYYNLCHWWGDIGEDGYCDFHRPTAYWNIGGSHCIPPREYLTRRGIYKRKPRFPRWTWKSHCKNPPRDFKRIWERRLRAMYAAEIRKRPYDPELMDGDKWLAGAYGYWS